MTIPTKVPPPCKLAHVVLRTSQMDKMMSWYCDFLGAHVVARTPEISFITYDDEHHRLAFMQIPDLPSKVRMSAGLEHMAFTWDTLTDLLAAYKVRASKPEALKPVWCVNHGPTVSLYYKDPDGNLLENQIDIMAPEEVEEFIREDKIFKKNPFGVDFDPDELYEQLQRDGEEVTLEKLRNRKDTGPRELGSVPAAYMN